MTVSGDGSWRKRGFDSLYGVTTIIGHYTGKVLDLFISSKNCKACEQWTGLEGTADYEEFWKQHAPNCQINHTGSSGKMEVEGMCHMFQRSEEKFGVKYVNYIGDGDSKTFPAIVNSNPYPGIIITKKECIGHVQKRISTRLRNLKKKTTGLGGKGKLTGKLIDELTRYYGLAIRRNCHSLEAMKNAVMATFYHLQSTDQKPQHDLCPTGKDSWCKWQKAKALNKLDSFHHAPALHPDVVKAIEPIYKNLSSDELLEKCVGGFTQNNNESFNNVLWRIAPKITHSGCCIMRIASYIAACTFNAGSKSYLQVMEYLGIKVGPNANNYCEEADENRLHQAEIQAANATREGRILRKQLRAADDENLLEIEGLLYGPGIAD
ncbi:uncharacterized protein [Temnothorax nylanderi]|uniref:uncharacterized protein n=1 Tax=Temnothorax nylanderi TaxID=102681 RepID=UPI003A8A2028